MPGLMEGKDGYLTPNTYPPRLPASLSPFLDHALDVVLVHSTDGIVSPTTFIDKILTPNGTVLDKALES